MNVRTSIVTIDSDNKWKHKVDPVDVKIVEEQLDTFLSVNIDTIKTSMLGTVDMIKLRAKQ